MEKETHHRIAVTNTSSFGRVYPEHLEQVREVGEVEYIDVPGDCHGAELARVLEGFDLIITSGTPQYDREFFELSQGVRLVARDGLGYNNVDVAAAKEAGALVTKVEKPVERNAVAEHTVALLLAIAKRLDGAVCAAREGRWLERGKYIGFELRGKTVGVIGCGSIGSRVAEILHHGFGMRVLANDPVRDDIWASANGTTYVDLDTLVREADVITTHATLNETSFHLIGADLLAKARDGVVVLNTARGDIVDAGAMVDVLESGKVAAYATDATSVEPPAVDDPLLLHPRAITTPHIGAYTRDALRGMGDKCVDDVQRIARGLAPRNIVEA